MAKSSAVLPRCTFKFPAGGRFEVAIALGCGVAMPVKEHRRSEREQLHFPPADSGRRVLPFQTLSASTIYTKQVF